MSVSLKSKQEECTRNDTYVEQHGTLRERLSLDAAFRVIFVILLEAVEVRARLQHTHLRVSI